MRSVTSSDCLYITEKALTNAGGAQKKSAIQAEVIGNSLILGCVHLGRAHPFLLCFVCLHVTDTGLSRNLVYHSVRCFFCSISPSACRRRNW